MSRLWSFLSSFGQSRSKQPRGRKARRRATPRPTAPARADRRALLLLEALEDRLAPANVSWTGTAGTHLWGDAGNWSNNAIPTSADDVTISQAGVAPITIGTGTYAVHSLNDTTAVLTIASGGSLSLAAVPATSTFGQNVTVQSGGTLTVGAGAGVLIQTNVTVTDNGTVTFATGDTVTFNNGYQTAQRLQVGGTGVLSATGTTFNLTGSYYNSSFDVAGGGHLQASGCTFALSWLQLEGGSVFNAGDLAGNAFDLPLYLPATDVQYLSGSGSDNLRFQDIDVLSGTLSSGSVALNAIGTGTKANLRYVFPGNFTVAQGASVSVAANVSVLIPTNVTVTDNGTLTFGSGDTVTFNNGYQTAQRLQVGGTGVLSAAGTTFNLTGSYYNSSFDVAGGGHLQASGSTFALSWLQLESGSVLNAGDLVGNAFDLPLYLPATDVQYLSGSGSDNLRFQDIDVLSGTLSSGSVALNAIGTGTKANLRYVFPGNFTVASGATVSVAANVSVLIQTNVTLTDNGTLTFGSGDTVTFNNGYQTAQRLQVGGTGVLSATGTTFGLTGSYYNSTFDVAGGGHLQASGSTFALTWLQLESGSVLNAGDLVGNAFDLPLYLPATDVQYLSGAGSDNLRFQDVNILAGTLTSGTVALNVIGTGTKANLRYVFWGTFTIASGASVSVAPNVSVLIQTNATVTDNGTLTFGSGDTVTFNNGYQTAQRLQVGGTGLLSAAGTTFNLTGSYYNSTFDVAGGGHLQASGCTFALSWLELEGGSVLNAGDLVGNAFDLPLYLPATDVQYLSGSGSDNLRFQDIDVLSGTLSSGTVALNAIGTGTKANLRYVFPGNFTVASGATVSVAANVSVLIQTNATVTDNGTLTFGSGDAVTFNNGYQTAQQLIVGGVLSATSTTFTNTGSYYNSTFEVLGGGHLQASGCTFALTWLQWDSGSVFNAGDLSGNAFDLPLWVPATEVQYLSGSGSNNLRFQDVNVRQGTLSSGQTLALNVIGTGTTANLRYVFWGTFTIASGAAVTVAPNVSVLIQTNATVTDNGTLTFGSGDTVTFNNGYQTAQRLQVGGTGVLSATGTTFGLTGSYYNSTFDVAGGGHLQASGCTFALTWLQLESGSVLNAGDLVGNAFDLPLYLPATYVQYLSGSGSNNLRFQDVIISAGTLTSGQTLALNAIGTGTTANLRYVFSAYNTAGTYLGNFTVASGATVAAAPNLPVVIQPNVTFTDNGSVTFSTGDALSLNNQYQSSTQLVVASGGVLSATGTTFTNTGSYFNSTINIASGGRLKASNSTFSPNQFTLSNNSNDTLSMDTISGVLAINSGATLSIAGNDFSNIGTNGVVASGDANATISLLNNYWGTTVAANIAAKIMDHAKNAALPTVAYSPYLNASPAALTGLVFNDQNGNGARDTGEPGHAGVLVYLDLNNNGVFDTGEPSTVTQANDPTSPVDVTGQFAFYGLAAGTYVVREVPPAGWVETVPSAAAVATTITFDGTGAEAGITGAGIRNFTFKGASFSDSSSSDGIFAPGSTALLASGNLAYNASSGNAEVDFSFPISSVSFFYVHGSGFAAGTATAYGADGSVLGTVGSKAATTKGDANNFVTLGGFAQPIARVTFSGAIIDSFTFTTAANNQAYFVRVAAGQTAGGIAFGDQTAPTNLLPTSVKPTATGFTATFSQPLNVNVLSLIDTTPSTFGPPDVTLVGQNTGPVSGSLVVSPDAMTVTFVKTAGLLAPDTYTLTLRSAANGFVSTTGNLLAGDGTPGDNLVSTFTVSAPPGNAVVVSLPSFARGYGQPVNVPASGNAGLPIILSTGQNVSSVSLTLHYNSALLTLSGFTTTISGASAVFNVPTPGTAVLSVSSATQLSSSAGPLTLGGFTASVPNNAPYGLKEVLDITNLSVFDNSAVPQPLPAVAQDGVHVAAYFGDLNGDQQYSAQDVTLEQRIIGLINSGFPAYQVADPVLLGDITLNGLIQANDTTLLQREVGQINVPNIPALPTGLSSPPSGGPDPEIFIPNVRGNPGDTVTVPVRLTVTEAAGITVSGFQVAIAYDPSTFTVGSSAQLGSLFASAGFAGLLTFPAPGELIVTASSATGTGTLPVNTTTDLFTLSFTVAAGAKKGTSVINLLNNIRNTPSALFANDAALTRMTLSPAPTNNPTDPVDGTFFIGATPPVVTGVAVNGNVAALAGAQRSLVRSLVYTFDQPVTLAAGAFTIALHQNVTVNGKPGQTVGVLPTLGYSSPDGGLTWVVSFSGAGVVNGSVADGVYDLSLHAAAVTDAAGLALSADRVDTFYRLFGDVGGNRKVNNQSLAALSAALNKRSGQAGYLAYLDYDGNRRIDNGDLAQFAARYGWSFGGF